jgi:peptidoglycan LD-endopeptidase LytH
MSRLEEILKNNKGKFSQIMPYPLTEQNVSKIDLSSNNKELALVDLNKISQLSDYIQQVLKRNDKLIGIGGYNEDREIYKRSSHFGTNENVRSIHLGVDIWSTENTPIFSLLDGLIHSFKINDNYGDYGPTIILEHNLEGERFYTLYGHLSIDSLSNKHLGQNIKKGEHFASLGNNLENGNWPPHLHFQIITDMGENWGDFPGVSSLKDRDYYIKICPNPLLMLNIDF